VEASAALAAFAPLFIGTQWAAQASPTLRHAADPANHTGDTYEATLAAVRFAIAFHVETFGRESLAPAEEGPVLEAFVAEVAVPG
jgi:hypothetical protein